MKNLILLFLVLPIHIFSQTWGYSNNDFGSALYKSGNYIYITGHTKIDRIQNSDDVFVLKIDLITKKIVFRKFNNKYNDKPFSISMIDNYLVISGESNLGFGTKYRRENAFVLKLSDDLNIKYKFVPYFTGRDGFIKTKKLSDGNFFSVGYSRSFNTGVQSIGDIFVFKSTSNFDTLWHKAYYSKGNDYCVDFVELDNEDIVLLANLGGFINSNQADYRYTTDTQIAFKEIDSNGNEIQTKQWGGEGHDFANKIIKAPDNSGYYVIGSTQSFGNGSFDILLLKVDNNFNELWNKTYGDNDFDYGNSILYSEKDKKLFVLGSQCDPISKDVITELYSLDLNGNVLDKKEFSLYKYTYAADMCIDENGEIYILGNCYKNRDDKNVFLISYQPQNNTTNYYFNKISINVFPNPVLSGNDLFFQLHNLISDTAVSLSISVYDLSGKRVLAKDITTFNEFSINTSGLKKGMYLYSIQVEDFEYLFGKFLVD